MKKTLVIEFDQINTMMKSVQIVVPIFVHVTWFTVRHALQTTTSMLELKPLLVNKVSNCWLFFIFRGVQLGTASTTNGLEALNKTTKQ